MIPNDTHLQIGSLLFEGIDQIDLTGPFEVLSRIPNSTYRIYGKTTEPVRDLKGLRLTPDATLGRCAATRRAACARRLRPGSPDGGCRRARLDPTAGRGRAQHLLGVHGCAAVRRRRPAEGKARDNALGVVSSAAVVRRHSRQRTRGDRRELDLRRRRHRRESTAPCVLRRSCGATRWRRPSSSIWPMHRSRPSTAARRKPRRPQILAQTRQSAAAITAQREATARRVAASLGIAVPKRPLIERLAGKRGEFGISANPVPGYMEFKGSAAEPESAGRAHRQWRIPIAGMYRQSSTTTQERNMTTQTFTKMAPPQWLLDMWKEIDEKTFGKGFDCFAENAVCNLGRRRLARTRNDPCQSARLHRHRIHRPSRGGRILGQPAAQDLPRQGRT